MELNQLNQGQAAAVEGLYGVATWDRPTLRVGAEPNIAVLTGFAGTGKTTIIKTLLDLYSRYYESKYVLESGWMNPNDLRERTDKRAIAVTAPTSRAKEVISNKVGRHYESLTVQALLGFAPNVNIDDYDINKPEFESINEPKMPLYKLVIVDEGSMLPEPIAYKLFELAIVHKVVLIIAGDKYQCKPVKERNISVVFDCPAVGHYFELTEPARQAEDNPILDMCNTLRLNINTGKNLFKCSDALVGEGEESVGYRFINNMGEFGSKLVSRYAGSLVHNDPTYCKMLSFTNERVNWWNEAVRSNLISRLKAKGSYTELDDVAMIGELLVGWNNYPNTQMFNSVEYKVLAVNPRTESVEYGKFVKEFGCRTDAIDVRVLDLTMIPVGIGANTYFTVTVVIPEAKNYEAFKVAAEWFLNTAKLTRKWSEYKAFKAKYMLMQDMYDSKRKKLIGKDLDYSYALTVHKSQGGTYTEIYIDDTNISKVYNNFDRNSLKYVAISRAAKRAIIYTGND